MTVAITPIDIDTETWGTALNRLNSVIEVISNNAITVGGTAAVGDSEIDGSLTATELQADLVGADTAEIDDLDANTASITTAIINAANVVSLTSNTANIKTLTVDTFNATTFSANNVESLLANNIVAVTANTSTLNANNANVANLNASSRLRVNANNAKYLATIGSPSNSGASTFNDRTLGVAGAGGVSIKLEDTTNSIVAAIGTFGDNVVSVITQSAHSLVIGANNSEVIRVTDNGHVGMGTVSPVVKLHVSDKIASGSSATNARITSDASEPRTLSLIDADGKIRLWRTAASGESAVEFAVGTGTAITAAERWMSGATTLSYFVRSFNGATGTDRLNVLKSGAVGIGTGETISNTAILEISSSNRGFLPPRMTTAQRDAITSPAEGLIIYNTTEGEPQFYKDGWKSAYFSASYNDLDDRPSLGTAAFLAVGTAANTVAAGNDARITGAVSANGGTLTGGYIGTSKNLGNLAGVSLLTPIGGNIQHGTNNGIATIRAPLEAGVYTMLVEVTNSNTAGVITLSGFSKIDGDDFNTTNNHVFLLHITKTQGRVKVVVEAMQ
jgi:hypothetical protein